MRRLSKHLYQLLMGIAGEPALVAAPPSVPLRQIFHRFWPYARPYRRWLALTLVFVALAPAIDTLTIWLFKLLVDDVLVPRNFDLFLWIALAYVGLTLLDGLVSVADAYLSAWIGERFLLGLRTSFFRHLQQLSPDFFEQRQLGDVLARLNSDLAAIEELLLSGVTAALSDGLSLAFFTAALFYIQWQLALVALLVSPPFWLVARYFSGLIKQASREQRRRSGSISAIAEESLANASLVQAYNQEDAMLARFQEQNLGNFTAELAVARLTAVFSPIIDVLQVAGVLIVVAVGIWELAQGRLTLGGLLVFLVYLNQLYSPIRGLSRLVSTVYAASASAERIIEFLDQQPVVHDPVYPVVLERARGALVFEAVSFCYPCADQPVLHELSFRIEPSETLAVVGLSGTGKSTIAKLLLRFYDPTAGRILLDGTDLRHLCLRELRQNLALLPQELLVFDGTIRENIAFGRPEASEAEIIAAAKAADAHEFITVLPHGYETPVGQRGRRLSGGQLQRIAIARAMVRDAPILLLDEPTTGLDAESGQRILQPLQRLMSGRTTIIISHNLLLVHEATAIMVVEQGRVVEYGNHQELLRRNGSYARLYQLQDEAAWSASANGVRAEACWAVEASA